MDHHHNLYLVNIFNVHIKCISFFSLDVLGKLTEKWANFVQSTPTTKKLDVESFKMVI